MDYYASFKICLFGDSAVGKTSLAYRYITHRFIEETKSTLGADIIVKDLKIDDNTIKLQIWDFGGEKKFRNLLPVYASGSSGGIFMYDITRKNTLDNLEGWLSVFKKNLTTEESQIPILMVGGKKDLYDLRTVLFKDAKDLAILNNMYDLIECSAKTGENVENIFKSITHKILDIKCLM